VGRLFEYRETGESLDAFLAEFPTVERSQAEHLPELLREKAPDLVE
jgi:uncharacterized protein (DUF433 family)